MHVVKSAAQLPKAAAYREVQQQLAALFAGERNALANAANMSALLYEAMPNLNWAGFYLLQEGELVLGPFQGKVACARPRRLRYCRRTQGDPHRCGCECIPRAYRL